MMSLSILIFGDNLDNSVKICSVCLGEFSIHYDLPILNMTFLYDMSRTLEVQNVIRFRNIVGKMLINKIM